MRSLAEHLAAYGAYHRDPRNRLTHFVGVPTIVFGLFALASLVRVPAGQLDIGAGTVAAAALAVWYVLLDRTLGVALALVFVPLLVAAEWVAGVGAGAAVAVFAATSVVGWSFQLLGHRIEGNRPALVDNLAQIFAAPIFLAAEAGFALGWRPELRAEVTRRIQTAERPGRTRARTV